MRLYKFEITQRPKTIIEWHPGDDIYYHTVHLADPALRKEWEATGFSTKDSYYNFFLPSENKLYRSRSSARDKVRAVERWGGGARILEAEVSEFIPVEEANRQRRQERDLERINRLRAKIDRIRYESGIELPF